ncbi:hypothetical protein ACFXD5_35040 [Streptomyces sp. NPDC059385]|uniref:hypothetical protein n=1 Tax=Streptomyces sp. NPDC059385 TaxID=3346817 RepID=UPI0036CAAF56
MVKVLLADLMEHGAVVAQAPRFPGTGAGSGTPAGTGGDPGGAVAAAAQHRRPAVGAGRRAPG